jgi:hypothetical protein
VNNLVASLVGLQELDKGLETLRQAVSKLSAERERLREEKTQAAAAQENSKKALTEAQLKRKNFEIEIDTKDQLVRKHSGELNSVKSNDAYRALLAEIEAAKKEKSALEDQALEVMVAIEEMQKLSKAADGQASLRRAALEARELALNQEEADFQVRIQAKQAERDAFAAGLPPLARERYEAIQRGRPGFSAVVPLLGMTCGGCRTGLTADVLNQVMKGKEIITCETCSRILYIVPAPPAPSGDGLSSGAVSPETAGK